MIDNGTDRARFSAKDLADIQAKAYKDGYDFAQTERAGQTRAIAGGIQAHSVGEDYPLHVVGYGTGDRTEYRIENLQTGKVLQGWIEGRPWVFGTATEAHEILETLRDPVVASVAMWNIA